MSKPTLSLPTRGELKSQARRLRQTLASQGTFISHAHALEIIAHQWGARDWNTLSAAAPESKPSWQIGQIVSGHYLGQRFTGRITAARLTGTMRTKLTVDFDQPVDVVTSPRFNSLRRRIRCTVDDLGQTIEKTSNGQPHVVLNAM